jgi:hypothetical protein
MSHVFLQAFYEIQAKQAGISKDNGRMSPTELVSLPRLRERARVRTVPAAINLLYALEPVAAALCLICLSPFLAILALAIVYYRERRHWWLTGGLADTGKHSGFTSSAACGPAARRARIGTCSSRRWRTMSPRPN